MAATKRSASKRGSKFWRREVAVVVCLVAAVVVVVVVGVEELTRACACVLYVCAVCVCFATDHGFHSTTKKIS
jgi:hypothetical protein